MSTPIVDNQEQEQNAEQEQEQLQGQSTNDVDIDTIVAQKLEQEREQMREQLLADIEAQKEEAEKLAKLSKSERERLEIEKMREELQKEKELLAKEKMHNEVGKQLSERGLPVSFAELLIGKDAEQSLANINDFANNWQMAVEAEVNKRLSQPHQPKQGLPATSTTMTKAQFLSMSYKEQVDFKTKNPEQFALIFN